jgi:dihydroflavonol-4-reductase
MVTRALKGEPFPLPDGGVNFIDVRDVAEAHVAAALQGKPGERYLLGGNNLSHLHCMGTISDALGVPINYVRVPKFTLPIMAEGMGLLQKMGIPVPIDRGRILLSKQYMYYDNRKAVRELGLKVRPFEDSVQDTFRWYLNHGFLNEYRLPLRLALRLVPNPAV